MTLYSFSEATQFSPQGGDIQLCHGSHYIAQGSFSDWVHILEACENDSTKLPPKSPIALTRQDDGTLILWDTHESPAHQLRISPADITSLTSRLEVLHQGCCEPLPFNLVADICDRPEEVLQLLQDMMQYPLSAEQLVIAKFSLQSWPTELEITTSDLHKLWLKSPQLRYFAKALKFYFWA